MTVDEAFIMTVDQLLDGGIITTTQDIADAMKLAPTAGTADAGSVQAKMGTPSTSLAADIGAIEVTVDAETIASAVASNPTIATMAANVASLKSGTILGTWTILTYPAPTTTSIAITLADATDYSSFVGQKLILPIGSSGKVEKDVATSTIVGSTCTLTWIRPTAPKGPNPGGTVTIVAGNSSSDGKPLVKDAAGSVVAVANTDGTAIQAAGEAVTLPTVAPDGYGGADVGDVAAEVWGATSRTLSGTASSVGAAVTASNTPIYYAIHAGDTRALYARIKAWSGSDITQAGITSITYTIYEVNPDDADDHTAVVDGHEAVSLTVANVIFDTVQTDGAASNYNFRHIPEIDVHPAFEKAGTVYAVDYTITPTTGQKIGVHFRVKT